MRLNSVKKAKIKNKCVIVRVDFNVPLKNNKIMDDFRIRAAIPTIEYLIKKQAIVVLMAHLGRPGGKVVESLRLDSVAKHLSGLINKPVFKFDDCIGPEVEDFVKTMVPGEVALLENLRFYNEEKENDEHFARSLANFSEVYVNDAFANSHRNHASMTGIARFIPSYAGLWLEKEVANLSKLFSPKRPFTAIVAGAKLDKLEFIRDLLPKVDSLVVGGVLANVLLKARGEKAGRLKADKKYLSLAKKFCKHHKLILPVDFVKDKGICKDIGPKTVEKIKQVIGKSKAVFWAGPLGVIEQKKFARGTYEIAWALAHSKAFTVVGGGESAGVVNDLGLMNKFSWVSTGGGAAIKFVQQGSLPGLKPVQKL